jgi:hypothetical protein
LPTIAPTVEILSYSIAAGPFEANSLAVAMTDEFMAAGDIRGGEAGSGAVQVYRNVDDNWQLFTEISGTDEVASEFGTAVDLDGFSLLVGAPGVLISGTSVPAGAAFYYSFIRSSETWEPLGTRITGANGTVDIGAANQLFGSSVGVSSTERIVVGAPGTSVVELAAEAVGRVYTYRYDQVAPDSPLLNWIGMQDAPIIGNNANDRFGAAVAISSDGTRFAAGAPGDSNGYVRVYQWTGSEWNLIFSVAGEDDEALGSSVTFLADDGSSFAVGGPNYGDNQGRVRIFVTSTQQATSRVLRHSRSTQATTYRQVEPAIIGASGDRLGEIGSISGWSESPTSIVVVASTMIGTAERFDYDNATSTWNRLFYSIDPPAANQTAISAASSADDLAIIGDGAVTIFTSRDVGPGPPSVPTPSVPTPAPVIVGNATSPAPSVIGVEETIAPSEITPSLPTTVPTNDVGASEAPTVGAPDPEFSWVNVGGPFQGPDLSQYGSALGLSTSFMAAGAPGIDFGAVLLYEVADDGTWAEVNPVVGTEAQSRFGTAIAMSGSQIVVGAPGQYGVGTSQELGAVFVYTIARGGGTTLVGDIVRGDANVTEVNENFGAAVGASAPSVGRLVVGAPGSNAGGSEQIGRVYVFARSNNVWTRMENEPILGQSAGSNYGLSVSMSRTGDRMIVGSSMNYVDVYRWDTTLVEWTVIFSSEGASSGESFGSSVVMINDDGTLLAVGGPNYNNGQGVIRVYEDAGSGYQQLGPDIVGDSGDFLGSTNTISAHGDLPYILAGTATGTVKRFDYNQNTNRWNQVYRDVPLGFGTGIRGVAATAGDIFVASGDDIALIFDSIAVV